MLTTLRDTSDSFENFRLAPQQFFEHEDKIVVVVSMTGTGRTSGVPVEERIAHLWTLRDGLAVELRAFTDPADALEAAGLPRTLI
jgi:ketosteroid isomerase-like protein